MISLPPTSLKSHFGDDDEIVPAPGVATGQDADTPIVDAIWVGAREELKQWLPRAGPVDKDVGELPLAVAIGEDHAHKEESALCTRDPGLSDEDVVRQAGAVDETLGEGRRFGERQRHLD